MVEKIKDILITWEPGLDVLGNVVCDSIAEILSCFPEYANLYPINTLGAWRSAAYMTPDNKLQPYESIDWYLARAWNPERKQVCINKLAQDMVNDPYRARIPQIQILVTRQDLYPIGGNFCLGFSQENQFSIISVARFLRPGARLDVENFKTVLMHEFCHALGVPGENRANIEENLGTHCTHHDCIMQQRISGDFTDVTHARLERQKRGLPPICDECVAAGKHFLRNQYIAAVNKQNNISR